MRTPLLLHGYTPSAQFSVRCETGDLSLSLPSHATLTPSAITFSVRLRDAPEQTVLLPNELPGQLDVHIYLANPGKAMATVS